MMMQLRISLAGCLIYSTPLAYVEEIPESVPSIHVRLGAEAVIQPKNTRTLMALPSTCNLKKHVLYLKVERFTTATDSAGRKQIVKTLS